jgi:hypothetical protein
MAIVSDWLTVVLRNPREDTDFVRVFVRVFVRDEVLII